MTPYFRDLNKGFISKLAHSPAKIFINDYKVKLSLKKYPIFILFYNYNRHFLSNSHQNFTSITKPYRCIPNSV